MGNAVTRAIGSVGLKLIGWKLEGRMPEASKFIILGAPHTSNWDAVAATFAMLASGFRYTFLIKQEWFFWPMGPFLKSIGGFPVNRSKGGNVVRQITAHIENQEKVCIGFPPEGTRSKVEKYKTGFLRVAYATKVPVFLVAFDGKNKRIFLDRLMELTGDMDRDATDIKAYVDANWVGVRPQNQ